MAERYTVSQVIVAHAYLQQENGEDTLRVRLINGIRESGELATDDEIADLVQDISVSTPPSSVLQAKVGDVLAESFFKRPSGNFPTLAEEAIETVIAKHAKPWKEQTLIDHSEAALIEASAYFRSISEWAQIRSALVSTPLIGSVQVRSLSRTGAEVVIRAYGDPDKLVVAMEAQGLALWTPDGEVWRIATPATAQNVRRIESEPRRRRDRFGRSRRGGRYLSCFGCVGRYRR